MKRRLSAANRPAPIGYVRVGYYKLKSSMADTVARRAQVEMEVLYKREPGFIGMQMVRCGTDELISISQWQTRAQAEAAVDRELTWARAVAQSVTQTESHVGAIVVAERA